MKADLEELKTKFADCKRSSVLNLNYTVVNDTEVSSLKMYLNGEKIIVTDKAVKNNIQVFDYSPNIDYVTKDDHKITLEGIVENEMQIPGVVGIIPPGYDRILNITEDGKIAVFKASYTGVTSKELVQIKHSIPFTSAINKIRIVQEDQVDQWFDVSFLMKSRTPVFYNKLKNSSKVLNFFFLV
jgi:hypothetical protein